MAKIEIPSEKEASDRAMNGTATPLDKVVLRCMGDLQDEEAFREDLTELVAWVKLKAYSEYRDKLQNAASEIQEKGRQIMHLKSGLEFYADRKNYQGQRDKEIMLDMGKEARSTLKYVAKIKKGEPSIPGAHFPQEV